MTATLSPARLTPAHLLTAAGPLWVAVSFAQAATRDGFDLGTAPLSMLSLGPAGWVQVLNFLVAGVLTFLGASALPGVWPVRLMRVNGVGLAAAGVFPMDAGTVLTWHSYLHMAAGTASFASLAATCFILARRFRRAGARGSAALSVVAGAAMALGDLWAMSGGAWGSVTIAVGAAASMLWVSTVAARV
ncbi:DUF998 domain-containing protein [Actinokineospora bangkokensis]|uniref:DUF998 domain-containing protein n=1 Tax=Actinokineospora bangkokensis TaxID=1193682 RepID=A0A1Q9LNI0_9PSEU|nr:DUF998 domain-containing protein [Actinokineospora bangkokensis]OLR93571.1 hypothetical protein BJP25_14890 [Actinokineospora bangkokensis]